MLGLHVSGDAVDDEVNPRLRAPILPSSQTAPQSPDSPDVGSSPRWAWRRHKAGPGRRRGIATRPQKPWKRRPGLAGAARVSACTATCKPVSIITAPVRVAFACPRRNPALSAGRVAVSTRRALRNTRKGAAQGLLDIQAEHLRVCLVMAKRLSCSRVQPHSSYVRRSRQR